MREDVDDLLKSEGHTAVNSDDDRLQFLLSLCNSAKVLLSASCLLQCIVLRSVFFSNYNIFCLWQASGH